MTDIFNSLFLVSSSITTQRDGNTSVTAHPHYNNATSSLISTLLVLLFCLLLSVQSIVAQTQATTANPEQLRLAAATFFGNADNNGYLMQIATDAQGNVYGTGFCTSLTTTPNVFQAKYGGVADVMIFKLDPSLHHLIWATYLGGNGYDRAGSICVDAAGEVTIAGITSSSNFPITNASDVDYMRSGSNSIFVSRLSADGRQLRYSRILGLASQASERYMSYFSAVHLALSPAGDAFVLGHTSESLYRITENAFQLHPKGSLNCVLSKISPNGSISYSSFIGGSQIDRSFDICYSAGKVYCSGTTTSIDFPKNISARTDTLGDCFVLCIRDGFTPRLERSYVFGTDSLDVGYALCVDTKANSVLMSAVLNGEREDARSLVSDLHHGAAIAVFDTSLTRLTSVTLIGSGLIPTGMQSSKVRSVFVAGVASETAQFMISENALQRSTAGGFDVFLMVLDSSLTQVKYGTFYGGTRNDYGAVRVLVSHSSCDQRVVLSLTTHSLDIKSTEESVQRDKLNKTADQPLIALFMSEPADIVLSFKDVPSSQVGQERRFEIHASSTQMLRSSVDFDLVCDPQDFAPTDGTLHSVVNGVRLIHMRIPIAELNSNNALLTAFKGRIYLHSGTESTISFRNVSIDESICATIETHPAVISTVGCFATGRNVEFRTTLSLEILPQPVADHATIVVNSADRGPATLEIIDLMGRTLKKTIVNLSNDHSEFLIDTADLSGGTYIARIRTATESVDQILTHL